MNHNCDVRTCLDDVYTRSTWLYMAFIWLFVLDHMVFNEKFSYGHCFLSAGFCLIASCVASHPNDMPNAFAVLIENFHLLDRNAVNRIELRSLPNRRRRLVDLCASVYSPSNSGIIDNLSTYERGKQLRTGSPFECSG